MKITLKTGEIVELFKEESGFWYCPVCGSPELESPPYLQDGTGSFQLCSCNFEFGFDDEPSASGTKIKTVIGNWEYWREKKIKYLSRNSEEFKKIQNNLSKIGVKI